LDVVRCLHEEWPEAVEEPTNGNLFPLHVAAAGGEAERIVRFLVEQGPEALQVPNVDDELPLHLAAANHTVSESLVQFLVDRHPESVRVADDRGLLPVHRAVGREHRGVLERFVEAWPHSLRVPSADGFIPLLHAALEDAPLDNLFYLAVKWPEAMFEHSSRVHKLE
jgi:Ankyrin repeats (3 copies)